MVVLLLFTTLILTQSPKHLQFSGRKSIEPTIHRTNDPSSRQSSHPTNHWTSDLEETGEQSNHYRTIPWGVAYNMWWRQLWGFYPEAKPRIRVNRRDSEDSEEGKETRSHESYSKKKRNSQEFGFVSSEKLVSLTSYRIPLFYPDSNIRKNSPLAEWATVGSAAGRETIDHRRYVDVTILLNCQLQNEFSF